MPSLPTLAPHLLEFSGAICHPPVTPLRTQVGKLQKSQTKGMTNLRGVLTVNVIRAKNLEVRSPVISFAHHAASRHAAWPSSHLLVLTRKRQRQHWLVAPSPEPRVSSVSSCSSCLVGVRSCAARVSLDTASCFDLVAAVQGDQRGGLVCAAVAVRPREGWHRGLPHHHPDERRLPQVLCSCTCNVGSTRFMLMSVPPLVRRGLLAGGQVLRQAS